MSFQKIFLFALLVLSFAFVTFASDQPEKVSRGAIVIHSIKNDLSKPLREMPPAIRPSGVKKVRPNPKPPVPIETGGLDPVIQTSPGELAVPAPSQNFDGISDGVGGFNVQYAPPDTNHDVGPNHIVQTVNVDFAVFNKTGTKLYGPVAINTLWSGFGGPCQTHNDGDPTVIYDSIANRFVIAQFALQSGAYQQCVAVSQTGDPTGAYYRYAFPFTTFPDYPKMGLWPDAYYTTFNMFSPYTGGRVCAFDRAKMLTGVAATGQCKDTGTVYHSPLPADLDGATLPPAGAPNYIVALNANNSNQLAFFKFHVDFTTPANTTLTGPTNLAVAAYARACGGGACIPQNGSTQLLDSLGDRVMNRLRYRNFGTHESLVVNHSVTASGSVGIRWYELRNPGGSPPTVFQQGTYSPDATYRWMGSAAMDKVGNIALGYSASSSAIKPAIRYAGRLVGDPLGQMTQGEGTFIQGAGSQQSGLNRWGDYSDLTIDPSNDCTFWYTTEYLAVNGTFNWHTRIAAFTFPTCTGGGGCTPPSGFANNTAVDVNACQDTGVVINWTNPSAWGDTSGTRTHDVLRNGVAIASGLSQATLTYTDLTGTNGTTYTYSVRHNNGCGSSATTTGASAADNVSGATSQTANQSASLNVKNATSTSALAPAFSITGATSANVTWSLSGNTNLTSCVAIRLRAPGGTETTLKAAGAANTGTANVLTFYQAQGVGTYTIVLQELAGCGKNNQRATLASTQMVVSKPSCP